ncbi:tRNA lysidine(34) synthetase TilS [Aestuariibius insulae]|uniref:tRNA lysidine(34) synthetase TilS n=1 Tax=Aestuariibius insulae TaxID=2058287 RepID=UPI00345E6A6E
MTLEQSVGAELSRLVDDRAGAVGIAVSGGSDSIALLYLTAKWARERSVALKTVTVNHGLRSGAVQEIALAAEASARLEVPHDVVAWSWDGRGNLQARARDARKQLIGDWASQNNVGTVLLGHTKDDQAETVLMRLARGSGVDGLAGMNMLSVNGGLKLGRPLLNTRREDLRTWLEAQSIPWADDPSNEDKRFDRVKAREMLVHLDELGLTVDRLTQTAEHMHLARQTLGSVAFDLAIAEIELRSGALFIPDTVISLDRGETARRILSEAIRWIGRNTYRPRLEALLAAVETVRGGRSTTLGGCLLLPPIKGRDGLIVTREPAATGPRVALKHGETNVWDGRWRILKPSSLRNEDQYFVGSLGGDGLMQCDWRQSGVPREVLEGTLGIWKDHELVAAPLAGFDNGWDAICEPDFASHLLSH